MWSIKHTEIHSHRCCARSLLAILFTFQNNSLSLSLYFLSPFCSSSSLFFHYLVFVSIFLAFFVTKGWMLQQFVQQFFWLTNVRHKIKWYNALTTIHVDFTKHNTQQILRTCEDFILQKTKNGKLMAICLVKNVSNLF